MRARLFNLRNVPDDEAQEIRDLLDDNNIDYYETHSGFMGLFTPAIWLRDAEQLSHAKELLAVYQQQRFENARQQYLNEAAQGQRRTFLTIMKENPLRFFLYLVVIGLVLYLSLKPFFSLM